MKVALAFVLLATVAACGGGGDSSTYAGMSVVEATDQALGAVSDEAKKPRTVFHGRGTQLVKTVRGKNAEGRDAWIAVVKLDGILPVCIWIWVDRNAFGTTYRYDYGPCPKKVLRARPNALVT